MASESRRIPLSLDEFHQYGDHLATDLVDSDWARLFVEERD